MSGKDICWDFAAQCGCSNREPCPHGLHRGIGDWKTLDYSVQLQLIRRGGLKGGKTFTALTKNEEITVVE